MKESSKKGSGYHLADIKNHFTLIYENNVWGSTESKSGFGSTLQNTKKLRNEIGQFIINNNIQKIIDLPCGDVNWMSHEDFFHISYVGIDIVKELINENTCKFASKDRVFMELDITRETLEIGADLILVRDLLPHLSFKDINISLRNMLSSKSRFIGFTNFPNTTENKDLQYPQNTLDDLSWRPLNLSISPFGFNKPYHIIQELTPCDDEPYSDKSLYIYEVEALISHFEKI